MVLGPGDTEGSDPVSCLEEQCLGGETHGGADGHALWSEPSQAPAQKSHWTRPWSERGCAALRGTGWSPPTGG